MYELQKSQIIPEGISNDNFIGYLDSWSYEVGVTWMEKTVSSPYWTGMTLFTVGKKAQERKARRRHLMHDAMYSAETRVAFKGQVYSAPMDWGSLQNQLEKLEKETHVALPVSGEVLAARVRISIEAGLVDLNKCIKQATVRRNVVVQLIRLHKDAGHPDYVDLDMKVVQRRARELVPEDDGDKAVIPSALVAFLQDDEPDIVPESAVVDVTDKSATPAERILSELGLQREMDRARPLVLLAQRDTDAHKDVEDSRINVLSD